MTNRTKIIIIAIIVAILVIGIIAAININKKNAEETLIKWVRSIYGPNE